MAQSKSSRPSLAIIGLGNYYDKLRSGLWNHFDPVVLMDTDPSAEARLAGEERALFRHLTSAKEAPQLASAAEMVLILTPNDAHVSYAMEIAKIRKPMVIEKPIATSPEELSLLEMLVEARAPIYFSDFYVDVRAVPLLVAAGRLGPNDWRRQLVTGDEFSISDIGSIRRIEGRIIEDYSFRTHSWVGKRQAGGVIFDMMVHLLALLRCLFPQEELQIEECERLFHQEIDGSQHYIKTSLTHDQAEAYARLEGKLVPSEIEVLFEVQKGAQRQDRKFSLEGETGSLNQEFRPGHELHLDVGPRHHSMFLAGDRYKLTCRAIREWYDKGATAYGWDWSAWAARQAITARGWQTSKRAKMPTIPPQPHTSASDLIERRKFLLEGVHVVLLAAVVGLETATLLGAGDATRDEHITVMNQTQITITNELQMRADKCQEFVGMERLKELSVLLGDRSRMLLAPGTQHLYGRPKPEASLHGYPHDLNALAPFRSFGPAQAVILDVDAIYRSVRSGDVLVATGSPTSSGVARLLMAPGDSAITNLPYRIEEIEGDPFVWVHSGMEGKFTEKYGKRLIMRNVKEPAYSDYDNIDASNKLRRDVLLVSRLPGFNDEFDILLFSGFHGAGTQAAELLFRENVFSDEDLGTLLSVIRRDRYWQFVLDVDGVVNEKPMAVGHAISLSRRCPPQVFTPKRTSGPGSVIV
jgi:predicted dehydrogenase